MFPDFSRSILLENDKYAATVDIKYQDGRLSITGSFGRAKERRFSFGQIIGYLPQSFPSPSVALLCHYWDLYHLNDMKCGLPIQTDCLAAGFSGIPNYDICCEYLKKAGLYEVDGYKYGHAWKRTEVPNHVLQWLKDGKVEV